MRREYILNAGWMLLYALLLIEYQIKQFCCSLVNDSHCSLFNSIL